jgi:hypothetical protein
LSAGGIEGSLKHNQIGGNRRRVRIVLQLAVEARERIPCIAVLITAGYAGYADYADNASCRLGENEAWMYLSRLGRLI